MYDDSINNLLKGVADGSISVKDARNALEGVELTEAQMDEAIKVKKQKKIIAIAVHSRAPH